ncbi:MAG TPA: Hsp20 family protein [Azospirillaceae bacterium]|nr:Hsp20 family protein [Azospirillaceae bacterium]
MRMAYDFSPALRSMVGFDRMFDPLVNRMQAEADNHHPPDNIEKTDGDTYRIAMAVAGFSANDLSVTVHENQLIVAGRRRTDGEGTFLHRGLALRPFERRFQLADHMQVTGARLADGLLEITLVRDVPEEMKPRRIAIGKATQAKAVEDRSSQGKRRAA